MWVADIDFVSPEPVVRALQARAAHRVFGYPVANSPKSAQADELRQLLVERMHRQYNWLVQPEEIVFNPGVIIGFNLACHALAVAGGGVLMQPPVYHPFLQAPENAGMQRQEAGLTRQPDGSYAVDFEAFETAIDQRTRLFILCNPHNPVGRVYRKEELERMAEICLRRGVVICSDEIHCDLIYSGHQHIPIAALDPQIARNTITLMAPSKTFNLAGLKFAFAIIQNPELRERYQKSGKGLVGGINIMGWTAGLAAYRDGQEWLDQLLAYLESNREYLYEYVRQELPGISMVKPEGTYLAWLDCRQAGSPGSPGKFFLEKARVAFNDGAIFGAGGEGFVRLNFGCPRSTLEKALERMKQALVGL
jgi:cystathionine beta-lyase